MILSVDGRGGIAGNLFSALLLGMGADAIMLLRLPGQLGFPTVQPVFERTVKDGRSHATLEFLGIPGDETATWEEMRERITDAWLPHDCGERALRILEHRQSVMAPEFYGQPLEQSLAIGEELVDTLLDICAAVLLWDEIGRPKLTLSHPLELGNGPAWIERLLPAGIETTRTSQVLTTTPTGAAILSELWVGEPGSGREALQLSAGGEFVFRGLCEPVRASLWHEDLPPATWQRPGETGC